MRPSGADSQSRTTLPGPGRRGSARSQAQSGRRGGGAAAGVRPSQSALRAALWALRAPVSGQEAPKPTHAYSYVDAARLMEVDSVTAARGFTSRESYSGNSQQRMNFRNQGTSA